MGHILYTFRPCVARGFHCRSSIIHVITDNRYTTVVFHQNEVVPGTQEKCFGYVLSFPALYHRWSVDIGEEYVAPTNVGVAFRPCVITHRNRINRTGSKHHVCPDGWRRIKFSFVTSALQPTTISQKVCPSVVVDIKPDVGINSGQEVGGIRTICKNGLTI